LTVVYLHDMSRSLTYGRLSLKAKVLLLMLLATSDDWGRGSADPQVVKSRVCPNVPEISERDIPSLLSELEVQRFIWLSHGPPLSYRVVNWLQYCRGLEPLPERQRIKFKAHQKHIARAIELAAQDPAPLSSYAWLYLLRGRSTLYKGLYKIGVTKRPARRLRENRTTYGAVELEHTITAENARFCERVLHALFADRQAHINGHREWFALTQSDLDWIKQFERINGRTLFHLVEDCGDFSANQFYRLSKRL